MRVFVRNAIAVGLVLTVAGCASINPFSPTARKNDSATEQASRIRGAETVAVNRYLWRASLEVLDFLPIQTVDPFTGVISTGFGTPPGGGRAYRATVLVQDPALDARSLSVALVTRNGPASPATVRAVEDAILSRARQLRVQDGRL